jgi:hypothetical protein
LLDSNWQSKFRIRQSKASTLNTGTAEALDYTHQATLPGLAPSLKDISMNAQKNLLDIATKHAENPAIRAILSSIEVTRAQAEVARTTLMGQLDVQARALALEDNFHLTLSQSDCVHTAASLSNAAMALSTLFFTLACALESLGETTGY